MKIVKISAWSALHFGIALLVLLSVVLSVELSSAQKSNLPKVRTITVERIEARSDSSHPMFKEVPSGRTLILRCQDEGWGSVSLDRVRSRLSLDKKLGLSSWSELQSAYNAGKDAYLSSKRLKVHEFFLVDEAGIEYPRDELAFFGESEKGYRFRFKNFDACQKVDSVSMDVGQICQVELEILDGKRDAKSQGAVSLKRFTCQPRSKATNQGTPSQPIAK